jgi:competence protein ComEA
MDEQTPSAVASYVRTHPFLVFCVVAGCVAIGIALLTIHSIATLPSQIVEDASLDTPRPIEGLKLFVDVSGAVHTPGLIIVPITSGGDLPRLADAISRAGGLRDDADLTYISRQMNLAAPLKDGMKIYIPSKGERSTQQSAATGTVAGNSTINVNTASLDALDGLKGIGKVRAQQIIDHRPYNSINEISEKTGIAMSLLEPLSNEISF